MLARGIFGAGLVAVLVTVPAPASAQNSPVWTPLIASAGERIDIDRSSISVRDGTRRATLRYHVSPAEQSQAFRFFTLKYIEVDCTAGRTRILRRVDTSEPSRGVAPTMEDLSPEESAWHTYPAGSLGAITIERVCAFSGRSA
jgi:hypothetical protein